MKKKFTLNGFILKGFIQQRSKAIKLFAMLAIAGTSFANAQATRESNGSAMETKNDRIVTAANGNQEQNARNINSGSNLACPTISALSMIDVSYNKVLVEWSSVMNYDSILFQFTPTGSGLIRYVSISGNPNPNQYHIQGLLSQTTYDISVATICNGITSAYSAPLTVTTFAEPGPRLASATQQNPSKLHFIPNPASGQTKLKFYANKVNEVYEFRIMAQSGNILYSSQVISSIGLNEIPLDLSRYAPGLYIVKLRNATDISTEKLIVY